MSIAPYIKKVADAYPEFVKSRKGSALINRAGEAVPVNSDKGQRLYVYDGDMLLTASELKRMLATEVVKSSITDTSSLVPPMPSLIVDAQSKKVSPLWSVKDRADLSYSISKQSFGTDVALYNKTVDRMSSAASAWNGCCGVKIRHETSHDALGDFPGSVFRVQLVDWLPKSVIASSFFPSDSKFRRFVYISARLFEYNLSEIAGILKHELGHTLGFVHEWTKSGYVEELGVDGLYNKTKKLYTPDPESIMHTPADGTKTTPKNLSAKDKELAAKFYPKSLIA